MKRRLRLFLYWLADKTYKLHAVTFHARRLLVKIDQFINKVDHFLDMKAESLYDDDICNWCTAPMEDEICFNGKNICIPCCINAGNLCDH